MRTQARTPREFAEIKDRFVTTYWASSNSPIVSCGFANRHGGKALRVKVDPARGHIELPREFEGYPVVVREGSALTAAVAYSA